MKAYMHVSDFLDSSKASYFLSILVDLLLYSL